MPIPKSRYDKMPETASQEGSSPDFATSSAVDSQAIKNSIINGTLLPRSAIELYPGNLDILIAAVTQDKGLIHQVSSELAPLVVQDLVQNGKFPWLPALMKYPTLGVVTAIITANPKLTEDIISFLSTEIAVGLVHNGTLTPARAMELLPDNLDVVTAAVTADPTLMNKVSPALVSEVTKNLALNGEVSLVDALDKYPDNLDVITAVVTKDPTLMNKVSPELAPQVTKNLVLNGTVSPEDALDKYPDNLDVVTAVVTKDPTLMDKVSPALAPQVTKNLVLNGTVSPVDALDKYPDNLDVVTAAVTKDPTLMNKLSPELFPQVVRSLIDNEIFAPLIAITPDLDLITAALTAEPTLISEIPHTFPPQIVKDLIDNGTLLPAKALELYPYDVDILTAAVTAEPELNDKIPPDLLLEVQRSLILNKIALPEEGLGGYLSDLDAVTAAVTKDFTLMDKVFPILVPQVVNELIRNGIVPLSDILDKYPSDLDIVIAVVTKDPTLMDKVSPALAPQVVRNLVQNGTVSPLDALDKYSDNLEIVAAAVTKDPTLINEVSPALASQVVGAVSEQLIKAGQWDELYELVKKTTSENYEPVAGPLNKSPATQQLESLARKMMQEGDFTVEHVNGADYFRFKDGTRYNWSEIRDNANWQQIELGATDMSLYESFMAKDNTQTSNLNNTKESEYLNALYADSTHRPDPPMTFAEMQAINIYTGDFYKQMNGLVRDETAKFDFRTAAPSATREALIHSVMCASGLRKVPMTNIPVAYRNASYGSDEEQAERVKAAATNGVITLDGFISASTKGFDVMAGKPVQYTYTQLRGAYVAPISQHQTEQEYLIPPTQVQISGYKKAGSLYQFSAVIVSDVAAAAESQFEPMDHADPAVTTEGDIDPSVAVEARPQDEKMEIDEVESTRSRFKDAKAAVQQLRSSEIDRDLEIGKSDDSGNEPEAPRQY